MAIRGGICQNSTQAVVIHIIALEEKVGSRQADFIECPGPAEQAGDLQIDKKFVEGGKSDCIPVPHFEALYSQTQNIGIEFDLLDTDFAAQVILDE